jgi:hypothetical protein
MRREASPRKIYQRAREDEADRYLQRGDFTAAETSLRETQTSSSVGSTQFSHAAFKLLALPFYELAYHPPTEQRIQSANDAYGLVATELLQKELTNFAYNTTDTQFEHLGRMSELAFFSLLIREGINNDISAVPVPASRYNDMFNKIDFFLTPVGTGSTEDGWPIQVKTVASEGDTNEFHDTPITLIGMNEIDPWSTHPYNYSSLTRTILREVDGQANDADEQRLGNATALLYEKITDTDKVRPRGGRRQWTLRRLASKLLRSPSSHSSEHYTSDS